MIVSGATVISCASVFRQPQGVCSKFIILSHNNLDIEMFFLILMFLFNKLSVFCKICVGLFHFCDAFVGSQFLPLQSCFYVFTPVPVIVGQKDYAKNY